MTTAPATYACERSLLYCAERLSDSPTKKTNSVRSKRSRQLLFPPIVDRENKRRRVTANVVESTVLCKQLLFSGAPDVATPTHLCRDENYLQLPVDDRRTSNVVATRFAQQTVVERPIAKVCLQRSRLLFWLPDQWTDPLLSSTVYDHIDVDSVRSVGALLVEFCVRRRAELCAMRSEAESDRSALRQRVESATTGSSQSSESSTTEDEDDNLARWIEDEFARLEDRIVRLGYTIDVLSDWQIDLYVAQAMDWTVATRHGAPNLSGRPQHCLLVLALAALSLVVKQHHADNHNYLALQMRECAEFAQCDSAVFVELERALLRSVDYNVLRFRDAYTTVMDGRTSLCATEQQLDCFMDDEDQQRRFARLLRTMIVDRADRFVRFSPWVRANVALAQCVGLAMTQHEASRVAPSDLEAKELLLACAEWRKLKINSVEN